MIESGFLTPRWTSSARSRASGEAAIRLAHGCEGQRATGASVSGLRVGLTGEIVFWRRSMHDQRDRGGWARRVAVDRIAIP